MQYSKVGEKYFIRFDKGEEIVQCLKTFCEANGIGLGRVWALGAVCKAKLGLFKTTEKEYVSRILEGDYEIASLHGNITTMDGEVYIHIHAVLSDTNLATYGGHLNFAIVSATCEMVIDVTEGVVEREFSDEIGLNLMKFIEY